VTADTGATEYSIDDYPGVSVGLPAGTNFTASASVAAANNSSVGKQVEIDIRELNASSAIVRETASSSTTLSSSFKGISVKATLAAKGDKLGVFVLQHSSTGGNAFYAQSIVLKGLTANLIANSSCRSSTSSWSGWQASLATKLVSASTYACRVTSHSGVTAYSIDDYPGMKVSNAVGTLFTATASVEAASPSAAGKKVEIAIRELNSSDGAVREVVSSPISLATSFETVSMSANLAATGDKLGVFVIQHATTSGDAFYARSLSLVGVLTSTTTPPTTPAPTPTTTHTATPASTPTTTHVATPAPTPTTTPAPTPTVFGHALGSFEDYGSQDAACTGPGAGHYRYVIIQWYMASDSKCGTAQIHAANPGVKILAYLNLGSMASDTSSTPSTGVTQQQAQAHDASDPSDSWFLHNASSNKLAYQDFTYLMAANIGRTSYQKTWEQRFPGLKSSGFDGIFADDTNTYPGHGLGQCSGCIPIAEYSTDTSYGQAMLAAVKAIGPAAQAAGLLFVPNVGLSPWDTGQRTIALDMVPYIAGFYREFFTRWGGTSANFTASTWSTTVSLMSAVESQGKFFLGNTYYGPSSAGELADQQYGVASWWLEWNGTQSSAWEYGGDPNQFDSGWGENIGTPTDSAAVTMGYGLIRHYTAGVAIVNPDPSNSQTFTLGGTYIDNNGNHVTSVTLLPGHGMVLALA